jgi:hypothetical protein
VLVAALQARSLPSGRQETTTPSIFHILLGGAAAAAASDIPA